MILLNFYIILQDSSQNPAKFHQNPEKDLEGAFCHGVSENVTPAINLH